MLLLHAVGTRFTHVVTADTDGINRGMLPEHQAMMSAIMRIDVLAGKYRCCGRGTL